MTDQLYYPQHKTSKKVVSSRLVRKEQKKLTQQTLIFAALTIGIFLLFIFVIMPAVVRFFFSFIDKEGVFEPADSIPPQTPVLEAPISATNSASIQIKGIGEANTQVVILLNDQEKDKVEINSEGQFEYKLLLHKGDNDLTVYGLDEAGNESVKTRNYNILMDNEAPKIEIETPTDGEKIDLKKNEVIEVKGKTEEQAKVYINDHLTYAKSDGSFSSRYQLKEGDNVIKIKVIDKAGNTSEKEIKVKFNP